MLENRTQARQADLWLSVFGFRIFVSALLSENTVGWMRGAREGQGENSPNDSRCEPPNRSCPSWERWRLAGNSRTEKRNSPARRQRSQEVREERGHEKKRLAAVSSSLQTSPPSAGAKRERHHHHWLSLPISVFPQ